MHDAAQNRRESGTGWMGVHADVEIESLKILSIWMHDAAQNRSETGQSPGWNSWVHADVEIESLDAAQDVRDEEADSDTMT
jgi:hypothetical protein